MTVITSRVLAVMTEEKRRNGRPEGGGGEEQSAYRFLRPKGRENVRGHCLSDGGQITVVKTPILM